MGDTSIDSLLELCRSNLSGGHVRAGRGPALRQVIAPREMICRYARIGEALV
jgi:hypothetical protein